MRHLCRRRHQWHKLRSQSRRSLSLALDASNTQTELYSLATGSYLMVIRSSTVMVKSHTLQLAEAIPPLLSSEPKITKAIGRKTLCMATGSTSTLLAPPTMANGLKASRRGKAACNTPMAAPTRVPGTTISCMVRAPTLMPKESDGKVFSLREATSLKCRRNSRPKRLSRKSAVNSRRKPGHSTKPSQKHLRSQIRRQ